MATLGYSSFFSSGLLAPDADPSSNSRSHTPDPTTPRPRVNTLDDTTPTAATHTIPAKPPTADVLPILTQAIDINDGLSSKDRPRMRRRRSSLGLSASPVTTLKTSPTSSRASVSGHVQRQSMASTGVASPGRSRAGSVTETGVMLSRAAMSIASNDATGGNSIIGRMRSGSVGTALRPRRLRKQGTLPAPLPPPPASPLPAVPVQSLQTPVPCRPKTKRSHTSESIPLPIHTPTLNFDAMDVDLKYSSPMDTPGVIRGAYF